MKLIHLSDLHIGKRVNEFSMLEDQRYILIKIINIIIDEKPDAVIIAGDIYDKSVPSADAVGVFDDFLVRLSSLSLKVFIISGNHDCPMRIAFGSRLMDSSGIHISPVYNGNITPIILSDNFGKICLYMLPFIKPSHVRRFYNEEEITSYTSAIKLAISNMNIDTANRNVLITHQFVTGATRSESEEISVGGSDNVDSTCFSSFDYVALGHIHGPQQVTRETIRYCGTPLKYSFSESSHKKSVTVVEMLEKGEVQIRTVPLEPKRDMREIKGKYMELTSRSYYSNMETQDYMHITLTDEEDIPDAIGKLRVIYPNIMKIDYDNARTRSNANIIGEDHIEQKSPLLLFSEFYEQQNNQKLSQEQTSLLSELITKVWEGE